MIGSARLRPWAASASWLAELADPRRRMDLVGGLTLILLLLTTEQTWVMRVGVATLAAAAAVDRRLLRRAGYWFAVLAVYLVGVSRVVLLIDNHEFLLAYWLLALALAQLRPRADGLAVSARLLVGFAFAFATLWKAVTPAYTSGALFHTLLLFDPRFVGVGTALGGLPMAAAFENYALYEMLMTSGDPAVAVPVFDTPGVGWLAWGMTWWTLAIEGLVAVCFLAPTRWLLGRARHVVLLGFLFTTYVLAPVTGFGWLLVVLGLAQAPLDEHRQLLPAYAAAFVLVLVRGTAPVGRLLALF